MPALARDHQHTRQPLLAQHIVGLHHGLVDDGELDLLPLPVQPLELLRDLRGLALVARGQQRQRQRRIADAACGIDARPKKIAQRIGIRPALEA